MTNELPPEAPLVSLVIPTYKVEKYLPEFLQSLSIQPTAEVEMIFVDDGSPDRSAELISVWMKQHPAANAHLVRQDNLGLSGARNTGLAVATGEWISFPDPDDILGASYLRDVIAAIESSDAGVSLVAAPLITYSEENKARGPRHPLHRLFARGTGVYNLNEHPSAIKIHANTTFLRRSRMIELGLRFDPRIRPNFEDSALIARYLASEPDPAIAAVPHAEYLYRTRADASSLVASSWTNPEKYTVLPQTGWLDLLEDVVATRGSAPVWLQNIVLYDMSWYFKHDARIHTPTKSLSPETSSQFIKLVAKALAHVDPEVILAYEITSLSYEIRMVWLALRGSRLDWLPVTTWRSDNTREIIQLKYYFSGERPHEEFRSQVSTVLPQHAKDRAVTYFGFTALYERIVWIPYRANLRVILDGTQRIVQLASASASSLSLSPSIARGAGWREAPPRRTIAQLPYLDRRLPNFFQTQWMMRHAQFRRIISGRSPRFMRPFDRFTKFVAARGNKYSKAWVFMDRDAQAQDNAEHLYRWVAREHPEVNSWFVLSKHSPDWERLANEGFRLVDHGSWQHTLLLLNAIHLASSHVDHYVVQPLNPKRFGARHWRYTFLQHGVTKDDISRWLNHKPIRRIISTGPAEQRGFTGNGTPYTFTDREAVLTGFPRHDQLLRLGARSAPQDRGSILVVPTWREYLLGPTNGRGNFRPLAAGFSESDYVRSWAAFLGSAELHDAARTHGKDIVFLPHPNLEPHIASLDLPRSIVVRRYADSNVQEVLADAALMVTDYSSIAFDGAYIGAPTVYFQFDRDDFFASHPHRPGYFSYDRDGFGPVTTSVEGAVSAVKQGMSGAPDWHEYRKRASDYFSYRDGGSCRRVFESMLAIDNPTE